jgi:hypothetical protein
MPERCRLPVERWESTEDQRIRLAAEVADCPPASHDQVRRTMHCPFR